MVLKKLLSVAIISSLSFGIISCNKADESKNQTNKNPNHNIVRTSEKKDVSNNDYENLKTVMNIDITNLLQDNFKSNKNIKRVIVSEKRKVDDENQKDKYIFFDIDKDKINNINSEEVANQAIELIVQNKDIDFWKTHNVTILFKEPKKELNLYSVYNKNQGSDKLIKIK